MANRSAPALSLRLFWKPLARGPQLTVRDAVVFALVIGALALLAVGGRQTFRPLSVVDAISLDPINLPAYALRTTLRMLAAMGVSLVFAFGFGVMAAKSRRLERLLIPLIDILQSVPVLGFLTFTVTFFLALFPGQVLGAEFAAIFAVFTSQAWNMALAFYQSLKTVPRDLQDVSDSLRLGAWRRFWTLEAPFGAPALVWNMMISMSGGWFFVVQAEAITVGATTVRLPGVGSYVALAIERQDLHAIGWAVLTMLVVILIYDQLMFRPLVAWAERFRLDATLRDEAPRSWLLDFIQRADLARRVLRPAGSVMRSLASLRLGAPTGPAAPISRFWSGVWVDVAWWGLLGLVAILAAWKVVAVVGHEVGLAEVGHVFALGFFTLIRVVVLTVVASLIWTPIGVMIGLRPRLAAFAQPVAQFLAAFPANLLFPLFVLAIVRFHGAPDVWLSPLMILGAQWYILFNVIGGAGALSWDLREAASSFRVTGWTWWKRVALPFVMPAYLVGANTAAGAAWNAAIVAEVASWGSTTLRAHGLGAYILDGSVTGDLPRVVLGVAVMCLYVVVFNSLLWRPLFALAERRLHAA